MPTAHRTGGSLQAMVKDVIFQGSSLRMIAEGPGGTELLVSIEADEDMPELRPGDAVTLGWAAGSAYLLRGRSEIVGATTTDVDEVQATMEGKDVSEASADRADRPASGDASRINRRALLIGGGVVAAGAIGAVILSGVGGGDDSSSTPRRPAKAVPSAVGSARERPNSTSSTGPSTSTSPSDDEVGTVDRFQDESGAAVNYSETFNDNNEVYGKEFAAYLDAGNPTPWDIAMPTYWMAARLKSNDWLAPLPFNLIPNYVNLEPQYLNLDVGPRRQVPPAVAGRDHRLRLQRQRSPVAS